MVVVYTGEADEVGDPLDLALLAGRAVVGRQDGIAEVLHRHEGLAILAPHVTAQHVSCVSMLRVCGVCVRRVCVGNKREGEGHTLRTVAKTLKIFSGVDQFLILSLYLARHFSFQLASLSIGAPLVSSTANRGDDPR